MPLKMNKIWSCLLFCWGVRISQLSYWNISKNGRDIIFWFLILIFFDITESKFPLLLFYFFNIMLLNEIYRVLCLLIIHVLYLDLERNSILLIFNNYCLRTTPLYLVLIWTIRRVLPSEMKADTLSVRLHHFLHLLFIHFVKGETAFDPLRVFHVHTLHILKFLGIVPCKLILTGFIFSPLIVLFLFLLWRKSINPSLSGKYGDETTIFGTFINEWSLLLLLPFRITIRQRVISCELFSECFRGG